MKPDGERSQSGKPEKDGRHEVSDYFKHLARKQGLLPLMYNGICIGGVPNPSEQIH